MYTSSFAYRRSRSDLGPRGGGVVPHHREGPDVCHQVTVWLKPIGGNAVLPDIGSPGLTDDNPSSSSSLLRDPHDSPTDALADRLLQRHGVTSSLHTPYDTMRPASSGDGLVSFCDWSQGHCRAATSESTAAVDYRSASALSGKAFPVPVVSVDRSSKRARLKQWRGGGRDGLGGGNLVHPGRPAASLVGAAPSRIDGSRMFLRHKTGVTKGEKEIMMGICQNRGDLPRASYHGCTDCMVGTSGLISHQDAWTYGKVATRLFPPVSATASSHQDASGNEGNTTSGRSVYVLDTRTPSGRGRRSEPSSHHVDIDSCMACATPRHTNYQKLHKSAVSRNREVPSSSKGKIPPPSTPVPMVLQSPVLQKNLHVTPQSMNIKPKPGGSTPRPKLLLNVHLPRVPSATRPGEDRDMGAEELIVGDSHVPRQTAWDQQENESR